MRAVVGSSVLVMLVLWIPACESPLEPEDLFGAYDLVEYSGRPLPVLVLSETSTIHVVSGSLELLPDLRFGILDTLRITKPDTTYDVGVLATGTFSINGSEVDLQSEVYQQDRWVGTVEGGRLTLKGQWEAGDTRKYERK